MPTLKGTEAFLSYVQCFLYLVSSSINVSTFHITVAGYFLDRPRVLKKELTGFTNHLAMGH